MINLYLHTFFQGMVSLERLLIFLELEERDVKSWADRNDHFLEIPQG